MNGTLTRRALLVGLAAGLGLGRAAPAAAQIDPGNRVETTHSRIPIDAVVSDPDSGAPVHFTGFFELLAQVTLGGPDTRPQIEGVFSADGVRGGGEERGIIINYKPIGLYPFYGNPEDLPASFPVVATFPLVHAGPGGLLRRFGSLEVSFDVMVGLDGAVTSSVRGIIIHG